MSEVVINKSRYECPPAVVAYIKELKVENAQLKEGYQKSVGVIAATDCVKCKNEVDKLLCDYGIKDISTLKYILDQYQKVIVNITNNRMSYLTYPAETILSVASDIYNENLEKAINDAVTDRVAYIKGYSKGYDDGRLLRDKVAETVYEVENKHHIQGTKVFIPKE